MTEDDLKIMRDEIARAIKLQVNGKIDEMRNDLVEHNKKHEADMQEIRPYLQFVGGLGVLSKVVVWIGGLALAALAIKELFFGGGPNITSSLQ